MYIYNIILYMYIIYMYTPSYMSLGGVFVVAFTPPSPDFCWCVWVTRSTCRAVVDSSHLIPQLLFFYLCPRVELLDSWQNGRQIWKPWCPWLVIWKFAVFPTKSANCHWVGSMEFSVVLTTRSWGFCARLPFIQVLKSWTPTKHWIAIIYRTFWNFIPSIYPPT